MNYFANKTKAEFFNPFGFGEKPQCFLEVAFAKEGSLLALSLLLQQKPIEDFKSEMIGSWSHDCIFVANELEIEGYKDITVPLLQILLQDELLALSLFEKAFRYNHQGVLDAMKSADLPVLSIKKKWKEEKKKLILREFEGELKRLCWDLTQQAEMLELNYEDVKQMTQALQNAFEQKSKRIRKS